MGSSNERDLRSGQEAEVLAALEQDQGGQPSFPPYNDPLELIVYDELGPCPYLPGQVARMPLRIPLRRLSREEFDRRLETGNRRQGRLLYRTQCPACSSCEPIRVIVDKFVPGKTQRRVLRQGERAFRVELGPPDLTRDRVALYNRHKQVRGLMRDDGALGASGYEAFLVDTCCETFELRYFVDDKLVGVAVVDRGDDALSAVYTYYDPDYEHLSPGVFSVLTQIELCRRWGLSHLYLGLYVEGCSRMTYKGRYTPHERLINGRWRRFDEPA